MLKTEIFQTGEVCQDQWKDANAQFDKTNNHLVIMGKPVMERWETPFMYSLADIVGLTGGRVLEIGFGLGIAASKIESYKVAEHVIIECNDGVYSRLETFAKNAPNKVTPMKGLWQDVVSTLADDSFDAILYDTYPLTEATWHTHQFEFIKGHAYRLLKPGGTLTYCNLTSWGKLMAGKYDNIEKMFTETQIESLIEAGFKSENISWKVIDIVPEENCRYYSFNKMIAPTVIKA